MGGCDNMCENIEMHFFSQLTYLIYFTSKQIQMIHNLRPLKLRLKSHTIKHKLSGIINNRKTKIIKLLKY